MSPLFTLTVIYKILLVLLNQTFYHRIFRSLKYYLLRGSWKTKIYPNLSIPDNTSHQGDIKCAQFSIKGPDCFIIFSIQILALFCLCCRSEIRSLRLMVRARGTWHMLGLLSSSNRAAVEFACYSKEEQGRSLSMVGQHMLVWSYFIDQQWQSVIISVCSKMFFLKSKVIFCWSIKFEMKVKKTISIHIQCKEM